MANATFNMIENEYPLLFPTHKENQYLDHDWIYRYYKETDNAIGINYAEEQYYPHLYVAGNSFEGGIGQIHMLGKAEEFYYLSVESELKEKNIEIAYKIKSEDDKEYCYRLEVTNNNTYKLKDMFAQIPKFQNGQLLNLLFNNRTVPNKLYNEMLVKTVNTTYSEFFNFPIIDKNSKQEGGPTRCVKKEDFPKSKLNGLIWLFLYAKGVSFVDSKSNEITVFVDSTSEEGDVKFNENKNPTNDPALNSMPLITNHFIEGTILSRAIYPYYGISASVTVEVKYTKKPYRILVYNDGEIGWYVFRLDEDRGIATFDIILNDNKFYFALLDKDE